ncbi:hypothetical protein KO498_10910 [Lentibacter algarum]|uniref:hypothetical protein n=1 Tax=Lentibacter algarum TaxID=576131 RepID=UPI001C07265C|nr:hypothetical protein [Lentibacter algarum]MBU2982317.1 hypothetical protein [Lentibacter algarum]
MEFIEKNKTILVQVVAGVLLATALNWIDLPVWLIGGIIAAVVSLWTGKMVEVYDRQIAPRLKDINDKDND